MAPITTTVYDSCRALHFPALNKYKVFPDCYGNPQAFRLLNPIIDQYLLFPTLTQAKRYIDAAWDFIINPSPNPADHHLLQFYTSAQKLKRQDGPLPEAILNTSNDPELRRLACIAAQIKNEDAFCKHLLAEIPRYAVGGTSLSVEGRPQFRYCGKLTKTGSSRCPEHSY